MDATVDQKRRQLLEWFASIDSCLVAFSGGVDSAVVAMAARRAILDRAVAVTGRSASLASGELAIAEQVAQQIGLRHVVVDTDELDRPEYQQNAPDRCYHCKSELYTHLQRLADEMSITAIVNGANADDLGDYRPGMRAAGERQVRSPLAECGIDKAQVRQLARHWSLTVWDKPAAPCLSSRIAYGEEVTPDRLAMVDAAEQLLRRIGIRECRVRYHRGDLARIEVPGESVDRLLDPEVRAELAVEFRSLGFKFVTVDLEGFRSGNLNQLVSLNEQYTATLP